MQSVVKRRPKVVHAVETAIMVIVLSPPGFGFEAQSKELLAAGCEKIFQEQVSSVEGLADYL